MLTKWLNQEMLERGVSTHKLSERLGKANSYVSQVLVGKIEPSVSFYIGLAEEFDVPIEKILRLAEILPPGQDGNLEAEPSLAAWIAAGKKLTTEERLEILNYADYVSKKSQRDEPTS